MMREARAALSPAAERSGAMFDLKAYYPAYSVREALRLGRKHPEARYIAGGSDLLIKLREGKLSDASLIGLRGVREAREIALRTVRGREDVLCLGSLCTFAEIASNPLVKSLAPMLGRAVDQAGGPQLRNVGTIGGNICNGATSADSAASLFAMNARLALASLAESGEGDSDEVQIEEVSIHDFYKGPGRVALKPGQLLTEIRIYPEDVQGFFGHYTKYSMREAMDIATLGCAVWCRFDQGLERVEDIRLAYGVAGPTPLRCPKAEAALRGQPAAEETFRLLGRLALEEINPRDSWRASREFRLRLAEELAVRGARSAYAQAKAERQLTGELGAAASALADCLETEAAVPAAPLAAAAAGGGRYAILRCTVNGKPVEKPIDCRISLADFLRNELGLTSVKKGCDVGECGACTVLLNGKSIDSCVYLAVWAEGSRILTTEGLAGADGELSPVQQAFIDEAAVQCGFCAPGLIMTATEIVDSGRKYTRQELRRLISGHLCRCTGYQNILNAVEKVAGDPAREEGEPVIIAASQLPERGEERGK